MDDCERLVKEYNRLVISNRYVCSCCICPRCGVSPDSPFSRHDVAARSYRVVINNLVVVIPSWRVRFRCPECKEVFTDYPSFSLPHKRFVKQVVMERSRRYLDHQPEQASETAATSYQQAVRGVHVPLGYEEEGKQVRRSTAWRWVTWLGSSKDVFQRAAKMLYEKDPKTDLHRKVYAFPSYKSLSGQRSKILDTAAKLIFDVRPAMERLFSIEIFTHFETACCG